MRLLAGLEQPTRGAYLINGKNVGEMSFEESLPYRLAIGYGYDYGGLIHNRTLKDNVLLPLIYHKLVSEKEAHEPLKIIGDCMVISEFKKRRVF